MITGSIQVLTFPHHDRAFRAHVEAAQARLGHWDGGAVETDIRRAYPTAVVRRAHPLAALAPGQETWYVYRDGAISIGERTGDWWLDQGHAETLVTADGTYLDANEAAADLFGVRRADIVARPAGSFTRHEGSEEVARRLFATLADAGSLHSTAVVTRPDGEEWPIEYHMRPAPAGNGYVVVMRRI